MAIASKLDSLYATRRTLLSRVKNPDDQESWKEFFDTYSKLVYSVAAKAGLNYEESQEVVQETFIMLSRTMPKFVRDPAKSFRSFVIHTAGLKIKDQYRIRKRRRVADPATTTREGRTRTIERVADPASLNTDAMFEDEWRLHLYKLALEKIKREVPAEQFQIFDLYVLKQWPVATVSETLGIKPGQVYVTKHRLTELIKDQIKLLETEAI